MAKSPPVFARDATGLVREVGAWPSFMAVLALVTGGVPVLWVAIMYTAPGANWPFAFFVAFLPTDWRGFQNIDVGRWFAFWLAMLNQSIIPCGTGPDEQWTISVAHNEEDIQKHLEAFDRAAGSVQATSEILPIVEAI